MIPAGSGKHHYERIITALTLLGLLVTIHLWLMSARGFDRGCLGFATSRQFEEMFDCESVLRSDISHFMGVSNVYWGMLFYAVFTLLNFLTQSFTDRRQHIVRILRLLLITAGMGFSIILSAYQYFWIQEFCALCLCSATIMLLLFVTSIFYWKAHPLTLIVPDGRLKFFTSALMITMFLGMGDILYFNSIDHENKLTKAKGIDFDSIINKEVTEESEPDTIRIAECQYKQDKPVIENYRDLITKYDVKAGNPDSDVIIIEYFDPNCFHCKRLHETMLEATIKFYNDAFFVYKPNPLWRQSVIQIQALLIAAEENLFFEMLRKQFIFQRPSTGLNQMQLAEIANEIGMNDSLLIARLEKGDYLEYILEQYDIRRAHKITSVPTILINGKTVQSKSVTVDCFETFINLENQ